EPDRVPATVHQWQEYHLQRHMGGCDDLEAFRRVGLDASLQVMPLQGETSETWRISRLSMAVRDGIIYTDYEISTPDGSLTYQTGEDVYTRWMTVPPIKREEDVRLLRWRPVPGLDRSALAAIRAKVGDDGIVRTSLPGYQAGCWQDACVLHGTEAMIYAAMDRPAWVHGFLEILLEWKLAYIAANLPGAAVDLVETGGGAGSNTVISPALHQEFCLPYDQKLHAAIKAAGHRVVYHTCGGMSRILDLIKANGCDASETLSPPGVGGDITDPAAIKRALSGLVLIGGLDQENVLTAGSPDGIRAEVERLFAAYGEGGGYIMSVCDHFFQAPIANLRAYAEAARECRY
ncbi:MAG: uroporphyrinogen decarboxylase family protein, partial [Bacteroidota bacterium]